MHRQRQQESGLWTHLDLRHRAACSVSTITFTLYNKPVLNMQQESDMCKADTQLTVQMSEVVSLYVLSDPRLSCACVSVCVRVASAVAANRWYHNDIIAHWGYVL